VAEEYRGGGGQWAHIKSSPLFTDLLPVTKLIDHISRLYLCVKR